ncbi:AsmA-like C-terminal region-containing protein [Candidatus Calescamantes bacterium]|nr:AsmA-like C-terminal region-containing protein [Candidatus Calescamantes bacterium]
MRAKILLYLLLFLILSFPSYSIWKSDFQIKGENIDIFPLIRSFSLFPEEWKIEGKTNPDLKITKEGDSWIIEGKILWKDFSIDHSKGKFYLTSPFITLQELKAERKGKEWKISSLLVSPEIHYLGFTFKNVKASLLWEGGNLEVNSLNLTLGEGKVHSEGKIQLINPKLPLDFKLKSEGIKLEKLAYHSGKGELSLRSRIRGDGTNPSSLNGWGKIKIEKGELGKIPIFLDIFSLLFRGGPSHISMHSAKGDFKIREGFAYTDNLELKGKGISISAKGYVGWNRKLDFLVFYKFSQELLKFTPLTELVGVVIDRAGNGLVRLRITGTLTHRQYTVVPLAVGEDLEELLKKLLGIDKNY